MYRARCVKKSAQKDELGFFSDFSSHEDRICFLDSMSQLSLPLSYEAIKGTMLEKKRYNDVSTIVTIIKTQQKQKETPKFVAGCLSKALL